VDAFRSDLVRAVGFATASEVKTLASEVSKLSKKVDTLLKQEE